MSGFGVKTHWCNAYGKVDEDWKKRQGIAPMMVKRLID
jgi:hypothetical protein